MGISNNIWRSGEERKKKNLIGSALACKNSPMGVDLVPSSPVIWRAKVPWLRACFLLGFGNCPHFMNKGHETLANFLFSPLGLLLLGSSSNAWTNWEMQVACLKTRTCKKKPIPQGGPSFATPCVKFLKIGLGLCWVFEKQILSNWREWAESWKKIH